MFSPVLFIPFDLAPICYSSSTMVFTSLVNTQTSFSSYSLGITLIQSYRRYAEQFLIFYPQIMLIPMRIFLFNLE